MSKYSFLLLLFLISTPIHAQSSDKNLTYFTGEITAGNYYGIDLHVNYIFREKFILKAGYSGHLRYPASAPYDYRTGFFGALSFGIKNPYDKLGNYHVMAGRIYNLNKKGTIRVNFSVGAGLTAIKEPVNWQESENGILYRNYTFDYKKYYTLGLIVNPKIEFPFTKYYGLTISPMLQINKDRSYIGIGIGQMLGTLRKDSNMDPGIEIPQ